MEKTIISPLDPSPDEYNIAAMLSVSTREQIMVLQEKIKTILGDIVWFTPPQCLHSTLMEIIWRTEYATLSRRQHFEKWYGTYHQTTKEIIASHNPFTIHFTELYASPGAIIIKAENTHEYNAVRNDLLTHTKLPEGTKMPPTIVHSSVARYAKSVDVAEVQQALQALTIDITETITDFKLVTDLVPPSSKARTLETYKLGL